MKVHVIGASGRSGVALCRSLFAAGVAIVPVVRSAERWNSTGLSGTARLADLEQHAALTAALEDAENIVSCAHARHAGAIIAAAPDAATFVFLGSTRKFTRWPDAHGNGVRAGERAFLASGRRGVMLHPTMIYGAQGEDNVQRLAALLRRVPFVPLPDGGKSLVQPIHQDDVTACIRAALGIIWPRAEALVIAGPKAITYADFVRAVASAAGLPSPRIVAMPAWLLRAATRVTSLILPRIGPDEIRRLTEDKTFDIRAMQDRLGIEARSLQEGLEQYPTEPGHASE
jgi:nucleoside-diphosphate-sugar epimerase